MHSSAKLRLLRENLEQDRHPRLHVPTTEAEHLIPVEGISCIRAAGAYSEIWQLGQPKPIVASKHLKFFETALAHLHYMVRCHRSALVNTQHIVAYKKGKPLVAVLKDGQELPVSRRL